MHCEWREERPPSKQERHGAFRRTGRKPHRGGTSKIPARPGRSMTSRGRSPMGRGYRREFARFRFDLYHFVGAFSCQSWQAKVCIDFRGAQEEVQQGSKDHTGHQTAVHVLQRRGQHIVVGDCALGKFATRARIFVVPTCHCRCGAEQQDAFTGIG